MKNRVDGGRWIGVRMWVVGALLVLLGCADDSEGGTPRDGLPEDPGSAEAPPGLVDGGGGVTVDEADDGTAGASSQDREDREDGEDGQHASPDMTGEPEEPSGPFSMPIVDHEVSETDGVVSIATDSYTLTVRKDMFKLAVYNRDGERLLGEHASRGLHFNGSNGGSMVTALCNQDDLSGEEPSLVSHCDPADAGSDIVHFVVKNELGEVADVYVHPHAFSFRISVMPEKEDDGADNSIALLFSELGDTPVYGLGDLGIDGNLQGKSDVAVYNNGHHDRFTSSFVVMPEKRLALVSIMQGDEARDGRGGSGHVLDLLPNKLKLSSVNVNSMRNSYVFVAEDMKQLYKSFSDAKKESGYPDVKPMSVAFGLGWEAWPALRANTSRAAVTGDIQAFIDRGYPIRWGVIGSGFWEDGGTTTSFNRWNTGRYGDPQGMLDWFDDNDLKLLLGLRSSFIPEQPEAGEAEANDFLVKDASGNLKFFGSGVLPAYSGEGFYLLDGFKADAVAWWAEQTRRWKVAGWKEDSMLDDTGTYDRVHHIGAYNEPMRALHEQGDFVMARNAYTSSPGSIQRINDTFGEQRRIAQLVLAYGSSGAPNVYTDCVGNDSSNIVYLARHTLLSAVTAAVAIGKRPWESDEGTNDAILGAVNWHQRYLPSIFSAAVDTFETGYPYTATPLHIAYPDDASTYDLDDSSMWQWMIGESMLAHPVFAVGSWTRDVYLPEGTWIDFNTGDEFVGPQTLSGYDHGMNKIPVFIGGKGILVTQDREEQQFTVQVWPVSDEAQELTYHHTDGEAVSVVTNQAGMDLADATVTDVTADKSVIPAVNSVGGVDVLEFDMEPGHDYVISN